MSVSEQQSLDSLIKNEEPLARYIFSKKHFSAKKNRIRYHAFVPYKHKVSVIRHKDCSEDCLLKIGRGIEKIRSDSLKAIGSLSAKAVRSIDNLDVESDTSRGQHRRHANIVGFNRLSEAKIRERAQDLANKANLLKTQ